MSEQRLIDANALDVVGTIIPSNADTKSYVMGMEYILNKIDKMPTIEERKTGKWIRNVDDDINAWWYECSECGDYPLKNAYGHDELSRWCPHCGCKMEGEQP